jgi:hypothetical protein
MCGGLKQPHLKLAFVHRAPYGQPFREKLPHAGLETDALVRFPAPAGAGLDEDPVAHLSAMMSFRRRKAGMGKVISSPGCSSPWMWILRSELSAPRIWDILCRDSLASRVSTSLGVVVSWVWAGMASPLPAERSFGLEGGNKP